MTMSIYAQQQNLVQRANTAAPLDGASVQSGTSYGLGTEINRLSNRLKCVWNFAVLGGATGASGINLLDDQGNAAILPLGAVVVGCLAYVVTAPVGATGTIALKTLATADLMAATAITSLTIGVTWQGKPVTGGAGAAWTTVGPVTAKLGSPVTMVIATAAMTAGLINFYIDWIDGN
jgi:hypothetical protein